ncbi:pentapeptide repeat-containing protein [Secundilactobacillus oryzae JCM 18671]|uniref:Pentapeptide repeat-containing protein n=1 Tax=Secundilactobacillus oryzae JCM 18671 TaxID=1291743 RepID=A0A081BHH1_9LACO|nr:pentapeptide repeat-containing protein [Secundilactobacillus oryzae]GAK47489.1 pentapeptide repeat-containing protein [Secundilactobacillus oryzae JCM 18671]
MQTNTIENQTLALDEVEPDTVYVNCHFGYSNDTIRISDVTFRHCEFQQSNFADAEWTDCTFENIDWLNATAHRNVFFSCDFSNCLLMGLDLTGSQLKQTTFTACKATYINVSETLLDHVTFADCQLIDSAFQAIKVKGALTFSQCDLTGIDFTDSPLKQVDISTSYFETLHLSLERIMGLTISPLQATQLITLLGVKISD